ncbi:hypothetical protein [Paraburkholderia terrae]|uniref:hypothetical protein n=1 Tax=Paraburkholderia terrae TaxID=311230 RepID=UPI003365893D
MGDSDDGMAVRMRTRVREAVELLARGWPEDYPVGAVEWLIADCRFPISDFRLPIADCRLPIADCRLPIAGQV